MPFNLASTMSAGSMQPTPAAMETADHRVRQLNDLLQSQTNDLTKAMLTGSPQTLPNRAAAYDRVEKAMVFLAITFDHYIANGYKPSKLRHHVKWQVCLKMMNRKQWIVEDETENASLSDGLCADGNPVKVTPQQPTRKHRLATSASTEPTTAPTKGSAPLVPLAPLAPLGKKQSGLPAHINSRHKPSTPAIASSLHSATLSPTPRSTKKARQPEFSPDRSISDRSIYERSVP